MSYREFVQTNHYDLTCCSFFFIAGRSKNISKETNLDQLGAHRGWLSRRAKEHLFFPSAGVAREKEKAEERAHHFRVVSQSGFDFRNYISARILE
jgi:hypothetical protein